MDGDTDYKTLVSELGFHLHWAICQKSFVHNNLGVWRCSICFACSSTQEDGLHTDGCKYGRAMRIVERVANKKIGDYKAVSNELAELLCWILSSIGFAESQEFWGDKESIIAGKTPLDEAKYEIRWVCKFCGGVGITRMHIEHKVCKYGKSVELVRQALGDGQ